jgi:DNA-directed RNA polymerase specialized sigma24 family protein
VRRGVVDFYRSRPPEPARDVAPGDAVTDASEARTNLCVCSVNLLATLRPAYAEVIRRVDMEGESPESAAHELRISTPTLHVRLHRARHALRERVMKHCGVATCGPCLDCTCDAHGRCGGATRAQVT